MNLSRVRHQWNRASRSSNAISIRIFSIFRQGEGEGSDPSFDSPRLLHTEIIIAVFPRERERAKARMTKLSKLRSVIPDTFEFTLQSGIVRDFYLSILVHRRHSNG